MTTEVTSEAPAAQTSDAPQTDVTQVAPSTAAPQAAPTEQQADDFSWVPRFFVKDGQPDFKQLATAYDELNKKFSSGVRGSFAPKDLAEYDWQAPEGWEVNEEGLAEIKTELQKMNVSKEAYNFLMSKHTEMVATSIAQVLEQVVGSPEVNRAALEQEWGEHFDIGVDNAKKAFKTFMPGHDPNDPILNHPTVMKLLAQIGSTLGEDSAPSNSKVGGRPTLTAAQVEEMMRSPDYYSSAEKQKAVTAFFESGGRI